MVSFPYGVRPVVLRAKAILDPYSGEATAADWTNPDRLPFKQPAGIAPRESTEPTADGRNSVITGRTLYAEPGEDVTAHDRVELPGDGVWQVDGDPADWRSPLTGWHPGLVIQLKRVEG